MSVRLEQLLAAATPGPWDWMHAYPQRITNPGAILVAETFSDPDSRAYDAELISKTPDMARLLIDTKQFLVDGFSDPDLDGIQVEQARALLARLEALGETTA